MFRVSVVMTTFNGERFLPEQLDSIVSQTRCPDEIIIVDDFSSDGTWEILENYVERYKYIRIIRNDGRLGINENFRKAMLLSSGDRIFISDQDDVWESGKISSFLDADSGESLVYSNAVVIDEAGRTICTSELQYLSLKPVSGARPIYFMFGNCVSGHNVMATRALILEACSRPIPEYVVYDQWLAFVASLRNGIKYIPEAYCRHRMHDANANNNMALRRLIQKDRQYFLLEAVRFREFIDAIRKIQTLDNSLRYLVFFLDRHAKAVDRRMFSPLLFMMLLCARKEIFVNYFTRRDARRLFKFCCGGPLWSLRYK